MQNEGTIYRSFIVTDLVRETENAKTFIIEPADKTPVVYEAGQFITLVFRKRDKEDRRSYSFSSAPALNEPLCITVKKVENGEYSRQLLHRIRPGDVLMSSGIAGFFRLPDQPGNVEQFVFLAAGSGITPVYSLLKTVLHTTDKPVLLIYSNSSAGDTIFHEGLLKLSGQFPQRFRIEFLFSQGPVKRRLSKFLLHQLLEEYRIALSETLFYVCGPSIYMIVVSISLITVGVPEKNIRKENFNTRPHTFKPIPPDTDAHKVEVFVNNSRYEFISQYPDTILAAAKKQQIRLPYSCEAGNCGSCTATCTEGQTWMAYNEVLTDQEVRQGKVLTCQAFPVGGDVVLKF